MKLDVMSDISQGTTLDKLASKYCDNNHKKVGAKLKALESVGFIIDRSATDKGEIRFSTLPVEEQKEVFRKGTGDFKKPAILENVGKTVRVLVIAKGDAADVAQKEGADFVGDEDMIAKIQGGWTDFDVCITTPDMIDRKSTRLNSSHI